MLVSLSWVVRTKCNSIYKKLLFSNILSDSSFTTSNYLEKRLQVWCILFLYTYYTVHKQGLLTNQCIRLHDREYIRTLMNENIVYLNSLLTEMSVLVIQGNSDTYEIV